MKRSMTQWTLSFIAMMALLLVAGAAAAEPPASEEAFKKRMAEEAQTPEGALQLWFEGLYLYMEGEDLGDTMLQEMTQAFEAGWQKKNTARRFAERLKTQQEIFRSYAKGAKPENGYTMDPKNFELDIVRSEEDSDGWLIGLKSGGADSPRLIYFAKDEEDGLWRVRKFDSIYVGVKRAE